MKLTKDELIDLLDEITSAIGQILASQSTISEDSLSRKYVLDSQKKIESIKDKLAKEKEKQANLKATQKRKEYLEKIRNQNQIRKRVSEGKQLVRITNSRGVTVGWSKTLGNGDTVITRPNGSIVAFQRGNKTYDAKGSYVGDGHQGSCFLNN
jgi:hypothetical protein